MTQHPDPSSDRDAPAGGQDRDDVDSGTSAGDVLEAFNARDVVDRPGEPPVEPQSPASDADVQPPA